MAVNSIIDKILDDAQKTKLFYLSDANEKRDQMVKEFEDFKEKYEKKIKAETEKEVQLIFERKNTVALLDKRKLMLSQKQELISTVFDKAKERLLNLSEKDTEKFLIKLLKEYGEDGEEIILAKDVKVSESFLEKAAKETSLKLKLSEMRGNFSGGLLLRSENCDKNLTLDTIMRVLREDIEQEVSKILFNKEV